MVFWVKLCPPLKVLRSYSPAPVSVTLWSRVFTGDRVYVCWLGRRKGLHFVFYSGELASHSCKLVIKNYGISIVFRGSKTNSHVSSKRAKGCCFGDEANEVRRRRLVGGQCLFQEVFEPDNYLYHMHRLIKIKAKISNISAIITQKL